METPTVALHVWVLGAFDPVLIAIAVFLGWKADQFAKVFIAAIAAVLISVPLSWGINAIGLPWIAPVGGEQPMLLQVRTGGAILWASLAFVARRMRDRGKV